MDYTKTLTADEIAFLENDLLSISDWIDAAIQGKINNCMKRAADQERTLLKAEGATMIPASDEVAAKALFARPGYKTRAQRDAESLQNQLGL